MTDVTWKLCRTEAGQHDDPASLESPIVEWIDIERLGPIGAVIPGTPLEMAGPEQIDHHDWWLRGDVDADGPCVLDFEGLSAPATIFVDDEAVATVESMFLPASCSIAPGTHSVVIRFESLTRWMKRRRPRGRWRSTLVATQGLRWVRTTLLGRAPAYNGVPPVVGPWRPVHIRDSAWLEGIAVTADPDAGVVAVAGSVLGLPDHVGTDAIDDVTVTTIDPDGQTVRVVTPIVKVSESDGATPLHRGQFQCVITVPEPTLWWPRGYGTPNVYRLTIEIAGSRHERIVGFRSVDADRHDGAFQLSVNGIDVFCRGAIWTPPDPCALTADRAAIRRQLTVLADAGVTMVRVIGGFVYEQVEFFEECAALGILVWQDTMLATFDPPEDLDDVVAWELSVHLDRVSGNPALAVVCGGNETIQQPEMLGLDAAGRDMPLLRERLPKVVAEHAAVPYVTASPSSQGTTLAIRPDSGVAHWFGVSGYFRPITEVRVAGVRFASECLAFSIPPSDEAVERHFGSLSVVGHHPSWKAGVPRDRTTAWDFEDVRDFYVREVFGVDPVQVRRVDPARYLQLGRLAVAEAMTYCFTFWRQRESGCSGALTLNARDLRAGAGWGLLDESGSPKLPLTVLARVWAPTAITIADEGHSGLRVDVHNDTADDIPGTLRIVAVDGRGNVVASGSEDVVLQRHSSLTRYDSELTGVFDDLSYAYRFGPPVAEAVEVTFEGATGLLLRNAVLTAAPSSPSYADLQASIEDRTTDTPRWDLTVRARNALRYVCVQVPGWKPSDNCFHLAPERPFTISLTPETANPATPPRGSVSSIDARDIASIRAAADVGHTDGEVPAP